MQSFIWRWEVQTFLIWSPVWQWWTMPILQQMTPTHGNRASFRFSTKTLTYYPEQILPRGLYFKWLLCGNSIITPCFLSSLAQLSSKKGVMDVLLPTSVVTFIERIYTLEVWNGSKWMTLVIGEWSPPIGLIGLWHRMCSGPLLGKDGPVKWGREGAAATVQVVRSYL